MGYRSCSAHELLAEVQRRGLTSEAPTRELLSEALLHDDQERGTDACTIKTEALGCTLSQRRLRRTAEPGHAVAVDMLVNQKIVSWTLNTLSPTLQLFFKSGQSCTIQGSCNAKIALDSELRFRLTDLTYQEDGYLTKSIQPEKIARENPGILVKEARIAQRTSMNILPRQLDPAGIPLGAPTETIGHEVHAVVGLRLEGMQRVGYIWAWRTTGKKGCEYVKWCDARLGGLRDDVSESCLGYPLETLGQGQQVKLFSRLGGPGSC